MEKIEHPQTLLQLGELLVQSGLVDYVGIPLGGDLQNHPDYKHKAHELLKILDRSLKREMRISVLKKNL